MLDYSWSLKKSGHAAPSIFTCPPSEGNEQRTGMKRAADHCVEASLSNPGRLQIIGLGVGRVIF